MNKHTNKYTTYALAFIINAIVLATINSISIETRFAIQNSPNTKISSFQSIFTQIFYYLKIFPYKISNLLGVQTKKGDIPEWIKFLYIFILSFIIAISVYHFFLMILGYKKIYKYFFGNLMS